jgi:EmrB/QacA subfamily drug resistance transporter
VTRAPSASPAERPAAGERAVLATVALACLLVPLNSTMIAVALPALASDLDTSAASAAWLVTGYLIAMASLQPVAGKLGDRHGRRPLVLGGLACFALASAGAALAWSLEALIALRVVQALAGALIFPNALALLRERVPEERLGARTGLLGSIVTLGAVAGPPVGGLLLAVGGWRWIFLVNLPLAAAAIALGWRTIAPAARAARAVRFDRAGALLLSLTLAAGAWALNGTGLPAPAAGALGLAALALGAALVAVELRRPDPVLQPRLFADRAFGAAAAGVALSNLVVYVTLLALPGLLAQRGIGGGPGTGLLLACLPAASLAVSPIGGRMADRTGPRRPAAAGLALLAAGVLPLALAPAALPGAAVAAGLAVAGAGAGLASSALQLAALAAAGRDGAGTAAGLFSTSRYAGAIAGTALLAGPLAPAAAGTGGYGLVFAVLVAAGAGAAAVALLLPTRSRPGRRVVLGLRPALTPPRTR